MKHIITLVLGDWSHDGHNQSETVNIRTNLNKKEMEKAYRAGTEKLGFDFCAEVAEDYEDNSVPSEYWELLKQAGYKNEGLEKEAVKFNDGEISLWTDSFIDIYLFIVKLGNDKFESERLLDKDNPQIKIGGYGLFSS